MALTGVIQRRDKKSVIIENPPRVGEIVYALDTEEYGSLQNGNLIWKKFDDIVKSVAGKTGKVILNKNDVGLNNVDNTSDLNKPINTATQNALSKHENIINAHHVTVELLHLENVDNTSDLNKPVSIDTRAAIDAAKNSITEVGNALKLNGLPASDYALVVNYFTKAQTQTLIDAKANVGVSYTKSEDDNLLSVKANQSDLDINSQKIHTVEVSDSKKAEKTYVDSELAKKTDKTDFTTLSSRVSTNENDINTNKNNVSSNLSKINSNKNDIDVLKIQKADKTYVDTQDTGLQTQITTNKNSITSTNSIKADKTYVDTQDDTLNTKITNLDTAKAGKTYVDTQDTGLQTQIDNLDTTKADKTYVDSQDTILNNKIDSVSSSSTDKSYVDNQDKKLQTQIDDLDTNKADKTYVDTQDNNLSDSITSKTNNLQSQITDNTNYIDILHDDKADKTYVDTQDSDLQSQISSNKNSITSINSNKADKTYVDTQDSDLQSQISSNDTDISNLLSTKADKTYVDTQDTNLQSQITDNTNYIDTLHDDKADKTYVDTQDTGLQTQITDNTNSITSINSTKADKTYVDTQDTGLQTQITDNTNSITSINSTKADKTYVDSAISGLDSKESVVVASTENIDLATGGLLTIDGVTLKAGDRVLVKNQTTLADNGIYDVVDGAWTRSTDADNNPGSEVSNGMYCFADEGTVNKNTGWILNATDPVDLGNDPLTFHKFSNIIINAGDILDKLKTVDGSGSGLDADLLDGQDSSFYRNASNLNSGTIPDARLPASISSNITGNASTATKLETARTITLNGDQTGSVSFDGSSNVTITTSNVAANLLSDLKTVDGSGSGLDADLLDGLNSTQFLRSDVVINTDINLENNKGLYWHANTDWGQIYFKSTSDDAGDSNIIFKTGDNGDEGWKFLANNAGTDTEILYLNKSNFNYKGQKVWTQGNDGSGSGLDADKLDGLDSTDFMPVKNIITDSNNTDNLYYKLAHYSGTQNNQATIQLIGGKGSYSSSSNAVSGGVIYLQIENGTDADTNLGIKTYMFNDGLVDIGVVKTDTNGYAWDIYVKVNTYVGLKAYASQGVTLYTDTYKSTTTPTNYTSKYIRTILNTMDKINIGPNVDGDNGIEIGGTSLSNDSTIYIDFHSGKTATDYDTRIASFGGNGSSGAGAMSIVADSVTFSNNVNVNATLTAVSIVETSSIRFKENVKPIENAFEIVSQLQGVTYDWIKTGKHDIGFIAEEVDKVLPELVEKDKDGVVQGMNYSKITSVLVETVKNQQKQINNLIKEVELLKK